MERSVHAASRCAWVLVLALAACAPHSPSAATGAAFPEPVDAAASAPAAHPAEPAPAAAGPGPRVPPRPARRADFGSVAPGSEVRGIADWALDSGDHRNAPFMVIDKVAARAYAFDRNGKLLGVAPVLLGLAKGDDTPPGIGDKPLSRIPPHERITGAGRYVAELGYNLRGEDVLWVDYDSGLSLHRVLTTNHKDRRAHRLATPTPSDNRISYGCINVPVPYFERVVRTAWRGTKGMVYILPETRPALEFFGAYDVDVRVRDEAAAADLGATARLR